MKKYLVTILVIGLFSILSTVVLAQGKGNRRITATPNRPVKSTPPTTNGVVYQKIVGCNQLTGDDLLFKNRQCKLPNGQITTVGKFCENYRTDACRQNSNAKAGADLSGIRSDTQKKRKRVKTKQIP